MSTEWNLAGLLISDYLYYHQITTPNSWCFEQIFGSNTTRSLVTSTTAMQHFAENRLVSFFQRGATVHSHVHLQVCGEYVYQHDMFNTFKWSIETNLWCHSESHSTCDCTSIDKNIWSSFIYSIKMKSYIEHMWKIFQLTSAKIRETMWYQVSQEYFNIATIPTKLPNSPNLIPKSCCIRTCIATTNHLSMI